MGVSQCQNAKDVIPICQEKARFIYICSARDQHFASNNCGKQPEWLRSGKGFSCGICDVFTDTHDELKEHNDTISHKEIMAIFKKMDRISREWFKQFTDPAYSLTEFASDAEKKGMNVDKEDTTMAIPVTPMNDLLFQDLDVTKFNEEEFVLASYDVVMEVHWPKPATEYYCRECNYLSFVTQQQLDTHKASSEHQNFEANYKSS